jgi:hypothetical protein
MTSSERKPMINAAENADAESKLDDEQVFIKRLIA